MTERRVTRLNPWKIIPISARSRRSRRPRAEATSLPPTDSVPAETGTRPLIVRISVDLPAPESPTTTTNSPSGMLSETWSRPRVPFG